MSVTATGERLEELISSYAEVMAHRMNQAARSAGSEEDVRHQCNTLIDEFVARAGLTIQGRHEYGLAGGRIDSKYGWVVIEYKDPHGAERLDGASGVQAVVKQIRKRLQDLQSEEHVSPERVFAVGCDGQTFVFVRQHGKDIEVEPPQPVVQQTVERVLRALVSLGAHGMSFTPENLAVRFGAESSIAQDGIRLLYEVIHETVNPKAQTLFHQWQILFGEVCGYDIHGLNPRIRKLAEHYLVTDPKPAELLFAVHTYYALFMKLLAAETVLSFDPLMPSFLKKCVQAPTSEKLRIVLQDLERGGIWAQIGVRNFLEGDLFSWYLDTWDDRCSSAVRDMTRTLDEFDPTTLSVEPAESRDLLKQLYHQLFPKSVRHDLGEYYTPDWLADLVLDELGYDGNPDVRLLDPACGSGTFLVMALNRVKKWFQQHRHECGYGEAQLLHKVLNNIIGFDLNPLAVMAARTNYLMAIRDLARHADSVELPVYLCDSVMTPSEYGDLFTGSHGKARRLKTSAGVFVIPNEISEDRQLISGYADTLEFCVRNHYSPGEFLQRCRDEGLPVNETYLHEQLYTHLAKLSAENKNGVWPRIIKNAFAPLFVGKVDLVVGNPPWVNWESLPEDYRQAMVPLWKQYGLFTLSGSAGRLGGGKKDLAMLFVYSAADNYLDNGGRLGFLITQSVFKTQGAGDGFRRFRVENGSRSFHLVPELVHDLSNMQVFDDATNRTALLICSKSGKAGGYPVPYIMWHGPSRISQSVPLGKVLSLVSHLKMGALPFDPGKPTSPWLTAPPRALSGIGKMRGHCTYQAYAGCCTWLNSVYWIQVLRSRPNGDLQVENMHNVGKIAVQQVQAVIEPDLVFPLLRGRNVDRWCAEPSAHIVLTNDPETRKGIPESVMKRKYPKTFAYLKQFEGDPNCPERGTLRGRSGYRKYFDPTDPFYSVYNVGPHTRAAWKVVWSGEVATKLDAAVVGPGSEPNVVACDQTVYYVPFSSAPEAHYFCAVLNSVEVRAFYHSVAYKHASMNFFQTLSIAPYSSQDKTHRMLSDLSVRCHAAVLKGDPDTVLALEREIDTLLARQWGITGDEMDSMAESLAKMATSGLSTQDEGEDE